MCEHEAAKSSSLSPEKAEFRAGVIRNGSRRRRLWELAQECHCPVIGVCLPLTTLRQAMKRLLGEKLHADDYELHVSTVNACVSRNRVSEILQDELEHRYAIVIRRFKCAKTMEALVTLWREAVDHGNVAGAFWAALTHPRCNSNLEKTLCREMHMIQHQAGAIARIERRSFDELSHEVGVLTRELAKAQERCTRLLTEKNREIEQLGTELMQLRCATTGKDRTIALLRSDLAYLRASVPDLESRQSLKRKLDAMADRMSSRDREVENLRRDLAAARNDIDTMRIVQTDASGTATRSLPSSPTPSVRPNLQDKTVLCVGGRSGNIANYRGVIEQVGGRFVHHDGGLEDNFALLEASLATADLIICQTGCISHNAYWRVKDHCRRTGKRCVFVDNPSASSLSRSLSSQIRQIAVRDITPAVADTESSVT